MDFVSLGKSCIFATLNNKTNKNMSTYEWAENECRIACKKENPDYDFDSDDFDYGCSCYKSALKAYKSLCDEGHSGFSFNITKNILIRLMNDFPLTPITDEDFDFVDSPFSDAYLKKRGILTEKQCPRMSSLFRYEYLDGHIEYHDVDRAYFIDIDNPRNTYTSDTSFLDKIFPITMPYYPKVGKYKIYSREFLTDKKNGDFDTKGIFYVVTPEGERVDLNIFKKEIGFGEWEEISKEEYDERYQNRIVEK